MPGEVTTQEILRKAADVIRTNGLHKGDYYEFDDKPANECKVCTLGAIAVAAGCDLEDAIQLFLHPHSDAERAAVDAAEFLAERIEPYGRDPSTFFVPIVGEWSDDEERTESQVIAALLVAAGGEA